MRRTGGGRARGAGASRANKRGAARFGARMGRDEADRAQWRQINAPSMFVVRFLNSLGPNSRAFVRLKSRRAAGQSAESTRALQRTHTHTQTHTMAGRHWATTLLAQSFFQLVSPPAAHFPRPRCALVHWPAVGLDAGAGAGAADAAGC